jgi:hypothetical protein
MQPSSAPSACPRSPAAPAAVSQEHPASTLTTTGKLIPTLTDLTGKVVKSVALGPHDSCRRLTRGSSLDSRSTRQRSPVRDRHWKDEIVATISPTQQIPIHWTYPSVPLGVRGPQSRTQRTGHSRRRLVRVRPRTPWGFKSPRDTTPRFAEHLQGAQSLRVSAPLGVGGSSAPSSHSLAGTGSRAGCR